MAGPTLPPLFRPTAVGDGTPFEMSARLPDNWQPVENPDPGSVKSCEDSDAITVFLSRIAGQEPFPDPAVASDTTPQAPADPADPHTGADTGADTGAVGTYRDHPQFDADTGEMLYILTDGGARYLSQTPHNGGMIATTSAGDPLHATTADGTIARDNDGQPLPIWVNEQGFECDPPTTDPTSPARGLNRLLTLLGSSGTSDSDDERIQAYDGQGVPITDFTVVKAGHRFTDTNRRRGIRMAGFITAAAAAFAGMLFIGGVVLGSQRVPAQGAISPAEATKYQLTDFPVRQATAFGADYLRVCLTHGNKQQMEQRAEVIDKMASPAAERGCGWDNGGNVQTPQQIVFNGTITTIPGYSIGQAAYLGYTVAMDRDTFTVTVPVWIGPTEGGGSALQVVGDIGLSASPPVGVAPNRPPETKIDAQLAATVSSELLETFFTAWGASDAQQLHLVLSPNATTAARNGLDGAVTGPELRNVTAFSDKARTDGQEVTYIDGDTATVHVSVLWTVADSQSTQATGYRVDVVRESGQWRVLDIHSGLVGAGGASNSRVGASGFTDTDTTAGAGQDSEPGALGGTDALRSGDSDSGSQSIPLPGTRSTSPSPSAQAPP